MTEHDNGKRQSFHLSSLADCVGLDGARAIAAAQQYRDIREEQERRWRRWSGVLNQPEKPE